MIKDQRSGISAENLQEIIEAGVSAAHSLQGGAQQYSTPQWLANACRQLITDARPSCVLDPQGAAGNLVNALPDGVTRYVTDIDNRMGEDDASHLIKRIKGNCVYIFELFDELYPHVQFPCIVANPPFGIRWKQADGTTIDSTQWTWDLIKKRLTIGGCGFLISNANTLERLGITADPWVYIVQRFPAGGIWPDCNVELGIVHFANSASNILPRKQVVTWDRVPTASDIIRRLSGDVANAPYRRATYANPFTEFEVVSKIISEEAKNRPQFNIYLDKNGMLRTYLSLRHHHKFKEDDVKKLFRVNNCHPLSLTTERDTRKLMFELANAGIYTIQPEAKAAIEQALAEVASLACPIRPVTDFELVAYADEEDTLVAISGTVDGIHLTPGKRYEVGTGTYTFTDRFTRKKIHFNEETEETTIEACSTASWSDPRPASNGCTRSPCFGLCSSVPSFPPLAKSWLIAWRPTSRRWRSLS
jgi:hypothetical protein